jgi:hypothetical protein
MWSKPLDDLGDRRDNVFQFVLSDHTFMSTWDQADSSTIGRWWDIEPASVLCATLIDLKSRGTLTYLTLSSSYKPELTSS